MSTPAHIAAQTGRRRSRLYLGAAAALLVLVVVGAWFLGRATATPESEPESAEPATPPAADTGDLELLAGESQALGRYPVGFPQTTQGAASAAVHGLQAQSTNDAQALADALNIYHRHDYDTTHVEQTILEERALDLFLSQPEGSDFDKDDFPVPGAYFYTSPLAVWWEEQDAETIQVLILADNEMSDGAALVIEGRYIYGRAMVWDADTRGGDWVVEEVTDPAKTGAKPLDEEYELDHPEWTPITIPDRGEGT